MTAVCKLPPSGINARNQKLHTRARLVSYTSLTSLNHDYVNDDDTMSLDDTNTYASVDHDYENDYSISGIYTSMRSLINLSGRPSAFSRVRPTNDKFKSSQPSKQSMVSLVRVANQPPTAVVTKKSKSPWIYFKPKTTSNSVLRTLSMPSERTFLSSSVRQRALSAPEESRSRTKDDESRTPDSRSKTPDNRSKTPDNRSRTPKFPIYKRQSRTYPVYAQLLNSISRDLDVMLRDLCHNVPYHSLDVRSRDQAALPIPFHPGFTSTWNTQQQQQQLTVPVPTSHNQAVPQYQYPVQKQRMSSSCLQDLRRQMGLLEQHSSIPPASSSEDINSSTSSEEYYSLDEEQNSAAFPDNSPSCSPDVFDSHSNDVTGGYLQHQYDPPTLHINNQAGPREFTAQSNITAQQRIFRTRPIWHLPHLGRAGAVHILHTRLPGVFVVRQSSKGGCLALSIRVGARPHIEHFIVESANRGLRLENSFHYFKELALLITYYAQNLDELPVKLQLPLVLQEADSIHKLNSYSLMGQDFWSSLISERSQPYNTTSPISPQQQRRCSLPVQTSHSVQHHHSTHTRSDTQWQSQRSRHIVKSQTQPAFNQRRPNVLHLQQNTTTRDSLEPNRVSLTQINHSDASPFTEIPKDIASDNRHDYVNVSTMDNSTRLFRPISEQSLCDNMAQPMVQSSGVVLNNTIHTSVSSNTVHSTSLTIPNISGDVVQNMSNISDKHEVSITQSVQDIENDIERQIESLANMEAEFEPISSQANDLHLRPTTTTSRMHTATKHLSLMPVYKTNGPVVFTFDLPTIENGKLINADKNSLQVPEATGAQPSPLSAKTQYSSPAYTEPVDSLIGKVAGVTQTIGAINVNNYLRMMEKAKSDEQKKMHSASVCSHNEADNVHARYSTNQCDISTSSPANTSAYGRGKASTNNRSRVCKSDTYITGALDSSLTCNPRYKVSLEEIPLTSQGQSYRHSAERSFSLKSLERNSLDRTPSRQGTRAQSLPRDGPEPLHHKPPRGAVNHSVPHWDQASGKLARTNSSRGPLLSSSFEENFFSGSQLNQEKQSPICRGFPLNINKTSSRRSLCSDKSTLEGILSNISPELTLEPIKPLTEKNVNRISEYDNFCNGFCNHGTRRGGGSSHRVVSSAGTHYSQPWDNNLLYQLLQASQKASSQNPPMADFNFHHQPDSGSVYPDSDALSQLGSDMACSTFEWRKKPDRDSATETTPQPALFEDVIQPAIYEGNVYRSMYQPPLYEDNGVQTGVEIQTGLEMTLSDDEGVSVEDIMETPLDRFPLHPHLIGPRGSETPGSKLENYVSELAEKAETMFGCHVDKFVKCTLEGTETNPHTVLRNVRQFMNGIKNYLVQHGERELNNLIELQRNRLGQDEFLNVDSILETSLHKCVVKPLKTHIYKLFVAYYRNCGQLEELSESIKYARTKTPQELGIRTSIQPPCGSSMEVIKDYVSAMQNASSPLSKLENLLGATATMVNSVQSRDRGSVSSQDTNTSLATDDLLPMLIYVLVQCGVVTAEIEADYMWGLLHPCVLAGEGGYYLTTFSSAVHLLKNLKVAMEANPGEVSLPSLGDLQGFMKIIIPDEKHNSIITKTLPVRPNMTTKDVCSMIAHRFRVTNPQDYGLYVLVMGIEDRVADQCCPQRIKADYHKERRPCVFAYKRNNAKFAWPVHFK